MPATTYTYGDGQPGSTGTTGTPKSVTIAGDRLTAIGVTAAGGGRAVEFVQGPGTFSINATPAVVDPHINSLTPREVLVGGPPTTLTVHGSGFTPASVVEFDQTPMPSTYVSRDTLTVDLPSAAGAGITQVTVREGAEESNTAAFVSKDPPPEWHFATGLEPPPFEQWPEWKPTPPMGGGAGPATGATAGTPGTWLPAGCTPPADDAELAALGIVGTPLTTWGSGEYVTFGNGRHTMWFEGLPAPGYWDTGKVHPHTGQPMAWPDMWLPSTATSPPTVAACNGWHIAANPSTPWTTGQFANCSMDGPVHWNGTAWVAGNAP